MRVVHLACVAPPEIGGIGQVAFTDVAGLRARGVDATLVTRQPSAASLEEKESTDHILRLPSYVRVGNAAFIKGLNESIGDADIIHLHYPWYGVAERILWRKPSVPVVVAFHMDAIAHDWRGSLFDIHRRWFQGHLLRQAARIIISSRDYAERSSLASYLQERPEVFMELPYGIDTDFFRPSYPEASISHRPCFRLLFVGGLDRAHHFKGLHVLLEALTHLPDHVELIIVGDGDERATFELQVRQWSLESRVTFRGRVDKEVLRTAYQTADALAFPSMSAAESFGLVVAEAQACGLPVVASRLPGVRLVIEEGRTGFLIEPGSVSSLVAGLQKLIENPSLCQSFRQAARDRALDRYSQTRHLDGLMQIYIDVCSKK